MTAFSFRYQIQILCDDDVELAEMTIFIKGTWRMVAKYFDHGRDDKNRGDESREWKSFSRFYHLHVMMLRCSLILNPEMGY